MLTALVHLGVDHVDRTSLTCRRWVVIGAIIVFVLTICLITRYPPNATIIDGRYINRRRIKRGGGPVRYTGWTVPSYGQPQQQYGYTTDQYAYDMNNYPQGQRQYGQGQGDNQGPYGNNQGNAPAYYDVTQTGGQGIIPQSLQLIKAGGYQPPTSPPPAKKSFTKKLFSSK